MKIRDLTLDKIVPGLRVRGLRGRLGTITRIDVADDNYAYIVWDQEIMATSGFYGTDSDIEVLSTD